MYYIDDIPFLHRVVLCFLLAVFFWKWSLWVVDTVPALQEKTEDTARLV